MVPDPDPDRAELRLLTAHDDTLRQALAGLPSHARHRGTMLFAASCAEQLFRWYDEQPAAEQREYSRGWRPVLDAVWRYAAGDDDRFYEVTHALGRYYLSPQCHHEGQDGPDDADQDEVAATYFAANCVVHGLVDFAALAAARVFEALDRRWDGEFPPDRQDDVRRELARQGEHLRLIAHAAAGDPWWHGAPPALVDQLRSG